MTPHYDYDLLVIGPGPSALRDRYGAGVAVSLEVTQAQEAVAAASEAFIRALYAHNLAKASSSPSSTRASSRITPRSRV